MNTMNNETYVQPTSNTTDMNNGIDMKKKAMIGAGIGTLVAMGVEYISPRSSGFTVAAAGIVSAGVGTMSVAVVGAMDEAIGDLTQDKSGEWMIATGVGVNSALNGLSVSRVLASFKD